MMLKMSSHRKWSISKDTFIFILTFSFNSPFTSCVFGNTLDQFVFEREVLAKKINLKLKIIDHYCFSRVFLCGDLLKFWINSANKQDIKSKII